MTFQPESAEDVVPPQLPSSDAAYRAQDPMATVNDLPEAYTDIIDTPADNSSINPTRAGSVVTGKTSHFWTPLVLQDWALAGFILCFVVILVALAALEAVDVKHDGLATTGDSEHYFWTYGPTAILAVIMAFWGQVEHRTKQLLPWSILRAGPTPAPSTLFLEYITLSQPKALLNSLKEGRWAVSLAITGSVLLKLLTVASTDLLILQTERVTIEGCGLIANDRFVPNLDATVAGSGAGLIITALSNGNLSNYPVGTSETVAFPTISLPKSLRAANISTIEISLDVFHADLECEIGHLESKATAAQEWPDTNDNARWFNSTPSDLQSLTDQVHWQDLFAEARFNIYSESCKTYVGEIQQMQFKADGISGFGRADYLDCATTTGSNSSRLIFSVVKLQQRHGGIIKSDEIESEGINTETGYDVNITNSILNETILSCIPTHTVKPMLLELDAGGNLLRMKDKPEGDSTQHIRLFDESALLKMYHKSMDILTTDNPVITHNASYPFMQDPTFQLFQSLHNPETTDTYFNRTNLRHAARTQFSAISAQWVKQSFMKTEKSLVKGRCHGTEQRLRVNGPSLRIMQAIITALIVLAIGLWLSRPKNVASRDPGSIGGLVTIISQSHALQRQLSGQGMSELAVVYSQLRGYHCENQTGRAVELSSTKGFEQVGTTPSKSAPSWRPFSVSKPFILILMMLLVALLSGLEISFHLSQANQGLATIHGHSYAHYAWTYVPALIMLCMQLCIGAMAFSCLLMAPYESLKNKMSSTRDVLLRDYLSQTAIQSVLNSVLSRDWAIFPITASLLLTPMLTIVVSGLFTTQATQNSNPINVTVTDAFNSTVPNLYYDNFGWQKTASFVLALYFASNYSLPTWTFEGFTFPEIRLGNSTIFDVEDTTRATGSIWNGSTLSIPLPAIRPSLDCSLTHPRPGGLEIPPLPGCPPLFVPFVSIPFNNYHNPKPFSMMQLITDVHQYSLHNLTMAPKECPIMVGKIGLNSTNFTTFACKPSISEMSVMTEFTLPSYAITGIKPNESTSRQAMNDGFMSCLTFNYMDDLVPRLFASPTRDDTISHFTTFFQAVMAESGHNPSNWPVEDFMGEENFPRLAKAMEHTFRIIISQAINFGFRIPAANDTPPITGTITNPNVWRLVQNEISTRILQGLLAAIALCVGTTFALMDVQKLLPKNPCSIAAAASLLAGSDILKPEITPEEEAWMSDAELKKAGVWSGYVFSLGWWSRDGEEMRFGIDAGRAEQHEV